MQTTITGRRKISCILFARALADPELNRIHLGEPSKKHSVKWGNFIGPTGSIMWLWCLEHRRGYRLSKGWDSDSSLSRLGKKTRARAGNGSQSTFPVCAHQVTKDGSNLIGFQACLTALCSLVSSRMLSYKPFLTRVNRRWAMEM